MEYLVKLITVKIPYSSIQYSVLQTSSRNDLLCAR